MVEIDIPTRERIPMRRSKDTSPPQLQRRLFAQIIVILRVQHAVRKRLPRPHAEEITRQPCSLGVDVVERWAFLRSHAGAHGAHAQPHAFVGVDEVGQDLGGGGDGDAAFVPELVEAALHA